jgi:acetyl-CoA synthetase
MADVDFVRNGQHNIGHICTRQRCDLGDGGRLAFRWIAPDLARTDYTFADLDYQSNRYANALQAAGFRTGDVLFIHLPKAPELFFSVLGALKLGVTVSTPFSRLGEPALADRMARTAAKGILTRRRVAKQLAGFRKALPSLAHVLVTDADDHQPDGVLSARALVGDAAQEFEAGRTDASLPSFIHFTPGPTAQARAVVHVHGAVRHIGATSRDILQLQAGELFWCTSDHGWVTGTSYGIVGPWSLGVSQVHFGGGYTAEGWLDIIARERVSVWYTSPSVIRMLMREDPATIAGFDLSHLSHVFSVGEWLDPDALAWSRRALGRDVYDTYFQTETGGIVIANRPGLPIRPGSMGHPVEGVEAAVLDDAGMEVRADAAGHLTLREGWASMFVDYLGHGAEYREKFSAGRYFTGDAARRDADGYFWFRGREDDIVNTAGHLVGPSEVEAALLACPEVADCAAVRFPDAVFLEKVVAFVVLHSREAPSEDLDLELKLRVSRRLSPIETPQDIRFVDVIERDPDGRINRAALRARHAELGAGRMLPWEAP